MYIPHIFRTDPFAGVAVFLYLGTIWWCIRVIRRRQRGTDRLLLGLLGLIALSQSFGVFKHLGILESSVPFHRLDDFVNLAIGGLYLIGALLLEISSRDRISAAVGLRLAQANPGNAARLYTQAPNAVLVLANDGFIVQAIRQPKTSWAANTVTLSVLNRSSSARNIFRPPSRPTQRVHTKPLWRHKFTPVSHELFKTFPINAISWQLRPKQLWFLPQISGRGQGWHPMMKHRIRSKGRYRNHAAEECGEVRKIKGLLFSTPEIYIADYATDRPKWGAPRNSAPSVRSPLQPIPEDLIGAKP